MLKASAGGGGKGIRAVHCAEEMEAAFAAAHGEAQSSFGDGRMLVEKMVVEPRHIEVQVIGDQQGNIYSLGTRECSIQRRHQKLIEEAPAVNLAEGVTERIQEAAVAAARVVGYYSAGTVEFLYSDGEFFFLEMNTRLQVEHPVTEEVFGVDLVELMIRVAGGDPLPDLSSFRPRGHAIEVRINAEDPANNFMPSIGTIHGVRMPSGPGVRVDAAVYHCMEITPYYDAMIGKLIASGADREQARRRMMRMLRELHIGGVTTSAGLSMQILQTEEFCEARADTNFVERYLAQARIVHRDVDDDLEETAAVIAALHRLHQGAAPLQREAQGGGLSPWVAAESRRVARLEVEPMKFFMTLSSGREIELEVLERSPGHARLLVNGREIEADFRDVDRLGQYAVGIDGRSYAASIEQHSATDLGVTIAGESFRVQAVDETERAADALAATRPKAETILASMPGIVVAVHVASRAAARSRALPS